MAEAKTGVEGCVANQFMGVATWVVTRTQKLDEGPGASGGRLARAAASKLRVVLFHQQAPAQGAAADTRWNGFELRKSG